MTDYVEWEDDRGSRYNEVEQWAHTHTDSRGILHKCWHVCTHGPQKLLTNWKFWVGMTMGFPLEHLLWLKVPIFRDISAFLGL